MGPNTHWILFRMVSSIKEALSLVIIQYQGQSDKISQAADIISNDALSPSKVL